VICRIEIFTIFEILAANYKIIMKIMRSHKELDVYQLAFKTSMEIFHITRLFPKEELYSLTSQIRRSSRSVSANLAEAFRKRRYEKAFVAKLSDAEAEAAETQVWIDYSLECGYISASEHDLLFKAYDNIIGKIVNMINHPDQWSI
jgi:four helix bundle protein